MLGSLLNQLSAMSQDERLVCIFDTVMDLVYELSEDDLSAVDVSTVSSHHTQ